jgi:ribosomal protein L29
MKTEELRKLSNTELIEKSNESVLEFKKVKFELKSGNITPENVNKARALKKDIARIKTVINELNLLSEASN